MELLEGEKAELVLLGHGLPVTSVNNSNPKTYNLTVWLFPFVKIIPSSVQHNGTTALTNGATPEQLKVTKS